MQWSDDDPREVTLSAVLWFVGPRDDRDRSFHHRSLVTMKHFYIGVRNTWYGEPLHGCNCGFESHEKFKVDAHINAEKCAEEIERMRALQYELRTGEVA